jgi:hypothetical protein
MATVGRETITEQVYERLLADGLPDDFARAAAAHPEFEFDYIATPGWTAEQRRAIGLDVTWEETLAWWDAVEARLPRSDTQ